jgi:hypothetical protein
MLCASPTHIDPPHWRASTLTVSLQVLAAIGELTRVIFGSSQQFLLSLIIQQHGRLIMDGERSPGDQPLLYP